MSKAVEKKEVTEPPTSETAQLREKQRLERKELKERLKKEKQEARKKKRLERLEKKEIKRRLIEEERAKKAEIRQKNYEKKIVLRQGLNERKQVIKDTKKAKRYLEVVTSQEDPLFIVDADVKNTKTQFLKIKNVDFQYWVKLSNQTPKIINSALLIWERRIPFTQTQTLMKETIVSDPIIPYEKKVIEYNELDSKRNGEAYSVRVGRVIFEDGTQWKNPKWEESEVSLKE